MEAHIPVPRKLWEHSDPKSTIMWKFIQAVNKKHNLNIQTFHGLHEYSIDDKTRLDFWDDVWCAAHLIHSGSYSKVVDLGIRIDQIPRWFEGTKLNFAENILFTRAAGPGTAGRGTAGKEDSKIALTEAREGGADIKQVTWGELRARVGALSHAMRAHGVKKGDRVAIVASNSVDTLVVFLAITSIGGMFSSSSTDMGTKGVLDRLLQIRPKFVFVDDAAVYNGKKFDLRPKMKDILAGMEAISEFEGLVSLPRYAEPLDVSAVPRTVTKADFLKAGKGRKTLEFEKMLFRDPFLVCYSSGTTGIPKCIVHSIGGVLLNAFKEGCIHRDLGPSNIVLQYTTTGWIMYLTSVLALLHGSRAILYDGSPFQPTPYAFIHLLGSQRVTNFGVSPRFMHTLQAHNISPRSVTDLSSLKDVSSTGMVLPDSLFEWFYDVGFPKHTLLANISGGTDLAGCFALGNPLGPLYIGGCMGPGLGMKVEVFDWTTEGGKGVPGEAVADGVPGELVCSLPFPNVPVYFWGDESGEKYFNAYYARFDNVWTHGDFIMVHPKTKQILFLGRADGVLNPSGVRFGSSEIYSVIEAHFPQILDSICVGQRRKEDFDESVMLFLMMDEGERFTDELVAQVKDAIKRERSPRHVPKWVFETPEIPTTINLKKVELPVKQIVSGMRIKPSGTLANPNCLEYYYQFAKVEEVAKNGGPTGLPSRGKESKL